jgi:hypothetical protein
MLGPEPSCSRMKTFDYTCFLELFFGDQLSFSTGTSLCALFFRTCNQRVLNEWYRYHIFCCAPSSVASGFVDP